jgi:hypothetical protein
LLTQAGFKEIANLTGGMLRWRAEGHPRRRRQRLIVMVQILADAPPCKAARLARQSD